MVVVGLAGAAIPTPSIPVVFLNQAGKAGETGLHLGKLRQGG